MIAGLIAVRSLHLRAIEETGLSAADEMLFPEKLGLHQRSALLRGYRCPFRRRSAASSDCQSDFDVASGMKNPTSGDFFCLC